MIPIYVGAQLLCTTLITKLYMNPLDVGYIHGDFNEQNIIVDSRGDIHGVIDFGDSQKNPLVYDIAIAIMYMMTKVLFQIGIVNNFIVLRSTLFYHGSPLRAPNNNYYSMTRLMVFLSHRSNRQNIPNHCCDLVLSAAKFILATSAVTSSLVTKRRGRFHRRR